MSVKPIEDRLDQMSAIDKTVSELTVGDQEPTQAQPIEYTTEPQSFEPVQVAGPIPRLAETLLKAPKRTTRPLTTPGKEVEKVGPYQVIPDADQATSQRILIETGRMPPEGKPSLTTAEMAAGKTETVFNLDQINDADGVKQFIEATARQYGADQIERVSYKDIAAKAAADGYDEAFLAKIIDPTVETKADPTFAYKMLLAITDAGKRAFDLGEKVKMAKLQGTLTTDLATQFHQAVALEGVLLKSAKGRQADIARTLGIFSQARASTAERGAMLDAVLNEAGGIDNAFDLAKKYTALDTRSGRAELAEKTIGGTLKDMWFSTWINGLLSGPVTHAKNIAGNMFFGAWQIPERAVASVIGKVRVATFGGEQAIQGNEVMAQAIGWLQGLREGGEIAWVAAKKNQSTDPFTKIESSRLGRDPFDIDMGDSETGKAMSTALKYWGKFVTLPGRALMAEDEFFKAVGYRMELNAIAVRQGNREYEKLIKAGVPEQQAAKQSSDLVTSILTNPPADIDEAAKAMSRTVTFTRDLEKKLQGVQQFMQNPLMKMFVPFVKTPTNIALEAMSRTPFLNFASPRFWADFNAGGIRRDMAIGRVTLGSGMVYAIGASSIEGKITGYGPMRTGDKQALEGTGWQPFSFVFNKSDISPELLAQFKEIATVSDKGPDKVYISYAGLEPLSTLLAIGSTTGEYSMMNPKNSTMEKLMMGGSLGIYQYLADQPMLQGFGEINKVLTSGAKDTPTFFYNLLKQASRQASEFAIGGSPLGIHSSFVATIERIMNPARSNVMPSEMSTKDSALGGAVAGFFEAVQYYKSRNPLTSDSLPPLLDPITGDVKKAGKGNLYESFNPFRDSDGKLSPAHTVLIEYGVPAYIPEKSIEGVQLSADQYNALIQLATADGALAKRLVALGKDPYVISMAGQDLGKAQALISSEISQAYANARLMLRKEFPDLDDAIKSAEEDKRAYGQYKR